MTREQFFILRPICFLYLSIRFVVLPQLATGLINLFSFFTLFVVPSCLEIAPYALWNNALGFLVLFLCAVVKVRAGYIVRLQYP